MNCTSCGANLTPGVTICPLCGTPAPYNTNPAGGPPQYDPNVPASPYGGTPPTPSTAYGTPSYGAPPPNPYATPPQPQQNFYGSPTQQGSYGTPPQQGGYVIPPSQPGNMYAYGTQPPPKRRSRLGLILGIIALVLVLACAGISFGVYQALKNTGNNIVSSVEATATAFSGTATTSTNTSGPPSGQTIDPAAAAIISSPQTSSAIDNNLAPTKLTTSFKTGQDVYVAFNISSNGKDGYIEAKWYQNGQRLSTRQFHHSASNDVGYFSRTFADSGDGIAELYWCTKADCSDERLAQVVKFTVATASIQSPNQPLAAFLYMYTRKV